MAQNTEDFEALIRAQTSIGAQSGSAPRGRWCVLGGLLCEWKQECWELLNDHSQLKLLPFDVCDFISSLMVFVAEVDAARRVTV